MRYIFGYSFWAFWRWGGLLCDGVFAWLSVVVAVAHALYRTYMACPVARDTVELEFYTGRSWIPASLFDVDRYMKNFWFVYKCSFLFSDSLHKHKLTNTTLCHATFMTCSCNIQYSVDLSRAFMYIFAKVGVRLNEVIKSYSNSKWHSHTFDTNDKLRLKRRENKFWRSEQANGNSDSLAS